MLSYNIKDIISILPSELAEGIQNLTQSQIARMDEIRLRVGQAPVVRIAAQSVPLLSAYGTARVNQMQLCQIINAATGYSAYASTSLCAGFLTIPGGHRIGVCGTPVYHQGQIQTVKEISSINIRIARDVHLQTAQFTWLSDARSVLLVGKPCSGKTTYLRNCVRYLSNTLGEQVVVIDERGEVASCFDGVPQMDVGRATDVISLCSKPDGIIWALRTMNPGWIALDEITSLADGKLMQQSTYCGVKFLATAHASDLEELKKRPVYRQMLDMHLFSHIVFLEDRQIKEVQIQTNDIY